jgi:hypothetical protein
MTLRKDERVRVGHNEYQREYQAQIRADAKIGRAIRQAVAASDKDTALDLIAEVLRSVTGE